MNMILHVKWLKFQHWQLHYNKMSPFWFNAWVTSKNQTYLQETGTRLTWKRKIERCQKQQIIHFPNVAINAFTLHRSFISTTYVVFCSSQQIKIRHLLKICLHINISKHITHQNSATVPTMSVVTVLHYLHWAVSQSAPTRCHYTVYNPQRLQTQGSDVGLLTQW